MLLMKTHSLVLLPLSVSVSLVQSLLRFLKIAILSDTFTQVVTRGAVQFSIVQCILYPNTEFYIIFLVYQDLNRGRNTNVHSHTP